MKIRIYLSLLCLFLCSHFSNGEDATLAGAEVGKWTMDFDAAAKLAAEKGLPIMLNFTGSDWCHWCIHMDKAVFAEKEWKDFAAKSAVLVMLDFPKDKTKVPANYQARNQTLQQQFGVQGYPSYIILDSDAKTMLGRLGAGQEITPAVFIDQFNQSVKFSTANRAAFVKANPEKAEAFNAAFAEIEGVENEFKQWVATGPQNTVANQKIAEGFRGRMQAATAKLDEYR